MIREQWSDVDITAYLDGELEPARVKDFKNALAKNNVLRQRVDALRKTLAILRETPLREVPRNYLLSPSMVADPKPAHRSSQWSIGFMRLATSLTAAAFVLTMGLNVLNRGIAPAAVIEQGESLRFMQDDAILKEDIGVDITSEAEAPVMMMAADTPTLEAVPVQEKAFAVEEPAAELEGETSAPEEMMELAPEAAVEAEDTVGIGGGEELPEAPQVEGELKVAPEADIEVDDMTSTEGDGEQPEALEVAESPEIPEEESVLGAAEGDEPERLSMDEVVDAAEEFDYASEESDAVQPSDDADGEVILTAPPGEERTEVSPEPEQGDGSSRDMVWRLTKVTLPQWVPLSLGIITLLLLGVTLLISSRRR